MFCDKCGALIPSEDSKFCPKCGNKIIALDNKSITNDMHEKREDKKTVRCFYCGAENDEGVFQCKNCKVILNEQARNALKQQESKKQYNDVLELANEVSKGSHNITYNNNYHVPNKSYQVDKEDIKRGLKEDFKKTALEKVGTITNIITIFYCILSIWGISAGVGEIMLGTGSELYVGLILIILVGSTILICSGKIFKITIISHLVLCIFLIIQYVSTLKLEHQSTFTSNRERAMDLGSHYYLFPIFLIITFTIILFIRYRKINKDKPSF